MKQFFKAHPECPGWDSTTFHQQMVIYTHKATFHKHRPSLPRAPQSSHSVFKWTGTEKLLSFLNIRKLSFRVFYLGSHRKYRTQGLGTDTALAQDPSSVPSIHVRWLTIACSSDSRGSSVSGLRGHLHSCIHIHTHILPIYILEIK